MSAPLVERLALHAKRAPERIALRAGDLCLDHARLWRAIVGAKKELEEAGLRPGGRVVLRGPNHPSLAIGYFASHACGAVAVPLGVDMSEGAVEEVVQRVQPSVRCAVGPRDGWHDITGWASKEWPASEDSVEVDPDAVADLLFTTGTTGKKKGVLLTQANIAAAADNINGFLPLRGDDVEVVPIPLSHSFGLGRLRCFAAAGHGLVPGSMANPAVLLKQLMESKATGLAIVPAGVALLRQMVGPFVAGLAGQLRYIELGSAAIRPEDEVWLTETLPDTRIVHHYGMTEVSRAVFRDVRVHPATSRRVGQASPLTRIRIRAGSGEEARRGEEGEIEATGPMAFQGYYEDADLTGQVLTEDGWVRTGDLGVLDEAGVLTLLGRKGDLINVGGLKVVPEDVERALTDLPSVEEAACIGAPDPSGILGAVVKAYVVVRGQAFDSSEAQQSLRSVLAEHELPRLFEVVDEIPKTSSGKIRRALLRQREQDS